MLEDRMRLSRPQWPGRELSVGAQRCNMITISRLRAKNSITDSNYDVLLIIVGIRDRDDDDEGGEKRESGAITFTEDEKDDDLIVE